MFACKELTRRDFLLIRSTGCLASMTEQLDEKKSETRAMFSNQLNLKRTAEFQERALAGIKSDGRDASLAPSFVSQ
jgi:hypothetical protein